MSPPPFFHASVVATVLFARHPAAMHTMAGAPSFAKSGLPGLIEPEGQPEASLHCIDTTRQLCDSQDQVNLKNEAAFAGAKLAAMRTACRGADWDGAACKELLEDYRNNIIHHVKYWVSTDNSQLFNRSIKMCSPPPIHHFRNGGGLRADIPCREGGAGAAFFFRHIWKAGGYAIEWNLADQAHPVPMLPNDEDWYTNGRCEEYNNLKINEHPTLFTFVRDPIEKFIAGYKELLSRAEVADLRGHSPGSTEHAKAFLDMVFHGTCENGHVLMQAQSLINDACESKFDFIGDLDNFEDDWAALSSEAWCVNSLGWPDTKVKHDSEIDDSFKFEDAMREALGQNDSALLKALCWWMLPDHTIFGYSLPPHCAADANLKFALATANP